MSTIPQSLTAALPGESKLHAEVVRWLPELGQFFVSFEDLLEIGARAEETRTNARANLVSLLAPGDRKSYRAARASPGA